MSSLLIGTRILTLERDVGQKLNTPDVWISVLIAGVLFIFLGIISAKLSQRFPKETFFQYNKTIVGKFFGLLISIISIIYYTFLSGYEVRILSELVHTYLLIRTPKEFVIITFICVGTYLVVGGINTIARTFQLYLPIILFILISILLLGMYEFEPENLMPVLGKGILPVIKSTGTTSLSFVGFGIIMVITSFMKNPGKAVTAVAIGIVIPTVVYVISAVILVGVLTIDEVKTLTWPLASFVNAIEYPGGFVENFQVFFLIVWIMSIYTTCVGTHYIASIGMSQVFNKEFSIFVYALNPVIYIVALLPVNINKAFSMGSLLGNMGLVIEGVLPALLLIIAYIRKKGDVLKKKNEI